MASRLTLDVIGCLCAFVMCLSAARGRREQIAGTVAIVIVVVAEAEHWVGSARADVV